MDDPPLSILYEDNHLLAVAKRAGLPTMGVEAGKPSLLEIARKYVKERYQKPGNVYLGIVSRLDAPVTGVVLLARTSKAARRLTEQFRSRQVQKVYWAAVEGAVRPECGECVDWVGHDERHRRMHIVGATMPGRRKPGSATGELARGAACRSWKSSCSPDANTKSVCNWPIAVGRSWATSNMEAGENSPKESPCTRAASSSNTR